MRYMTRRTFVSLASAATGAAVLAGLTSCAEAQTTSSAPSEDASGISSASPADAKAGNSTSSPQAEEALSGAPPVYFAPMVDQAALQAVFESIGKGLGAGAIGVKLSSGEPGGNHYLQPSLIEGIVSSVDGTIVECNTAYGGQRSTTEAHYQVAADHGFTAIADFRIMDEDGSLPLPVENGLRLKENLVGAAFPDYDGFLVLSHFKGHAMAGFGGALKNISIGMASRQGKYLIHSAGETSESWQSAPTGDFLEAMADACKAVLDAQPNMLFVNVMNNLSVDCDCDSDPAPPKMADVGILASADPVALDQACVDLVYASDDDSADLIERIESRDGTHLLEACEQLGVGSRAYELVEIAGLRSTSP